MRTLAGPRRLVRQDDRRGCHWWLTSMLLLDPSRLNASRQPLGACAQAADPPSDALGLKWMLVNRRGQRRYRSGPAHGATVPGNRTPPVRTEPGASSLDRSPLWSISGTAFLATR
jgi:hypothetical protein